MQSFGQVLQNTPLLGWPTDLTVRRREHSRPVSRFVLCCPAVSCRLSHLCWPSIRDEPWLTSWSLQKNHLEFRERVAQGQEGTQVASQGLFCCQIPET